MASTKKTTLPTSSANPPTTPPNTPALPLTSIHITADQVQQVLDILKQAQGMSNPEPGAGPSEEIEGGKNPQKKASKPDITSVYELYAGTL
jgi:hypothetical protein